MGIQNDETTRMVGENADAGANVGAPVVAEDGDSDILTYTLTGDESEGGFKIDAATGQITVGAKTKLDFESDRLQEFHLHGHGHGRGSGRRGRRGRDHHCDHQRSQMMRTNRRQ